ncbi:MAG: tyrosine-type recombinase/integrase [Alphaproteobacteria bacterium]|nr:tyrosine-type recombinase/integrase [Alphaproteobacteria bacterium]
MREKITKRAVNALTPTADGREAVLWDAELKGFGCRVQRGNVKSYILHYRVGSGRGAPLRKLTIGRHGSPWTPDSARAEAKKLLGRIEEGADPASDKSARRDAPTVTDIAERFLAEHVEAKRKTSTATEYRRLLSKVILPVLGKRKVADIARADIAKLHHANRATPYQANRVLAVLSKMFNLAERWGLRSDASNPCRHIEKFAERKRERMLSPAELGRLGDALAAHCGSPFPVAAIKLLVFTGARLGEVLGMRWEWVDFERGEARLPDSKSGAKTLHLPPPALEVLAGLERQDGNAFVIVGHKPGAAMVNLEKPWRAIRKVAELDDVRLHDLRHAFASVAASSGMGLPIIGKMLGHSQPATTHRYAHLAADPVKDAAAAVAAKIAAAMTSSGKQAKVEPLRGRR